MELSQVPNASIILKINSFAMKKDSVILSVGGHLKSKGEAERRTLRFVGCLVHAGRCLRHMQHITMMVCSFVPSSGECLVGVGWRGGEKEVISNH